METKKHLLIVLLVFFITACHAVEELTPEHSDSSTEPAFRTNADDEDVEHFIEKAAIKDFTDGPVKMEILGDTAHLFADEDFEKKEVILLRENDTVEAVAVTENGTNDTSTDATTSVEETTKYETCIKSNQTSEINSVQLVNGSQLTRMLSDSGPNHCFLVLFYTPWCRFSARVAPMYNALPRAFPDLEIVAFDVSKSIGYNTKFGTSAVPMIILFKQRNTLGKFNYTQKNLSDYIEFIANKTGFQGNSSINLTQADYDGPVPTEPTEQFDYYLTCSWAFLAFVSIEFLVRKSQLIARVSSYAGQLVQLMRRFKERLMRGRDPQHVIPALTESSSSVGSTLHDSGLSTTTRQRIPVVETDQATDRALAGGYNYRPRRNLHRAHDE